MLEPWMAMVGIVWSIAVVAFFIRRQQLQDSGFVGGFDSDDKEVVFVGAGRFHGTFELQTRDEQLKAHLWPEAFNKGPTAGLWHVVVPSLRLAAHTSLRVSFEGYSGAYREKLGMTDIHIGNEVFDKRFTIRGSRAEVVRAALAGPAVQQVITRLFEDSVGVVRFEVDDDGLSVSVKRMNMEASAARALLLAVRAIAVLLDDTIPADAPPREALLLDTGSGDAVIVGSDSGMPVGIKLR